jgi:hypothetical protein
MLASARGSDIWSLLCPYSRDLSTPIEEPSCLSLALASKWKSNKVLEDFERIKERRSQLDTLGDAERSGYCGPQNKSRADVTQVTKKCSARSSGKRILENYF